MKKTLFITLLVLSGLILNAQEKINPILLKQSWSAWWISCPDIAPRDYGVYHFTKTFKLQAKPERFIVHVSADNRYRLFVNGKPVGSGPARGDLYNWYFESLDIAPYLVAGDNIIAAQVWNMGTLAPVAQISNQTAFVLQGDTEKEWVVNTNSSWKVTPNNAYKPCSVDNGTRLKAYMVIGPGDEVNAALFPWGWEKLGFDYTQWKNAQQLAHPVTEGYGTDNIWTLKPRNIPAMFEELQRIPKVRRFSGAMIDTNFLSGNRPLILPANKKITILLDQNVNTVAYPELVLSRGKGASVKVTYAEALFKDGVKGNRNEIEGKEIKGNYDIFLPDGGLKRTYRPLWLRTYRYIQLDIITKDQPLIINDFYGMKTGYPFKPIARFESNDLSLKEIWDVGWRTAQLCAGENYYDCPYYEQLQYEGDTRIQALISLYVTGDDRLMRKALLDFYHSRVPEGLTQGRYPSNRLQVIPPFSLFWVAMVSDYSMHRDDAAFLDQFLLPIQGVLQWYENHIDKKANMLGPMKWWNFTDWNPAFKNGVPDGATDGNSAVITLQYAYTLQLAATLFKQYGKNELAEHYALLADRLTKGTYQSCFDQESKEMANTPLKNTFSQHAGIMAILSGAIPEEAQQEVMKQILIDKKLSKATFYYRFYLTRALKKVGMADRYYSELTPWRDMLKIGLTTFAENPDPARSDCHAWSASPNYDFLATICGITPDAPGFKKVLIQPALGELKEVKAEMPHPNGTIKVSLVRKGGGGIAGSVTLPTNTTGRFVWNDKEIALHAGEQMINL